MPQESTAEPKTRAEDCIHTLGLEATNGGLELFSVIESPVTVVQVFDYCPKCGTRLTPYMPRKRTQDGPQGVLSSKTGQDKGNGSEGRES